MYGYNAEHPYIHSTTVLCDYGLDYDVKFKSPTTEGAEAEFEHRSGKAKDLGTIQQYIYPMTTSRCVIYT